LDVADYKRSSIAICCNIQSKSSINSLKFD
jgi:hypothetical protein